MNDQIFFNIFVVFCSNKISLGIIVSPIFNNLRVSTLFLIQIPKTITYIRNVEIPKKNKYIDNILNNLS